MKLIVILITTAIMQVSASSFAQKITLNKNSAPLSQIINEIRVQSGYDFFYNKTLLKSAKPVTIKVQNASIEEVLEICFKNQPLEFQIAERTVMIKEREKSILEKIVDRFQAIDVRGKVVDESGSPLVGATVKVRGTSTATTTDKNGEFKFNDLNPDAILVITYLGYESKEIKAADEITIILRLVTSELNEVTVSTGYWSTAKQLSTGNIGKITAKEIANQPVSNPLAALQGSIAGLEVTQSTGVPSGNFKVRIRGTNSIANGNNPLVIVDGVPFTSTPMSFSETSSDILGNSLATGGTSPLNSINPSDIESMEILKDADATAIYGSRGSNGIILITTKKGKAGKTKVDVNLYSGIGETTRRLDLLNTTQYIEMRNEAFSNDNVTPTTANAKDLLIWDTKRYTDWQKELINGTAQTTDAQVSISGGERYTQFTFGAGYHKETTVFPGSNGDKRFSSHLRINNTSPNQKLKTAVSLNYSINNTNLLNKDLTSAALFLPPNAPALYDENGELNWVGWDATGQYENPLAYLKRRYESKANNLIASAEIGYSILPNLEIKSRFGYTNRSENSVNLTPLSSLAPSLVPTSMNTTNFANSTFQNWNVEPQINWKPRLGKGQFDVLAGTQFLDEETEGLAQTATGFSSEALMKNIATAPNRSLGTNYYTQYRYHAIFGRVNYNYDDRYILNITGRRDGSSRFGPGKQFANFGAIGAAWIFSSEEFFKSAMPFISFGKLRASYGVTGNDQLSNYQYLDAYTSSSGPYQGVVGLAPARLSNPDFAWEINKKLEAGLELGFIDDRINLAISLYKNRSSNQLVGYPLPPTTGFNSIQANFPATVQNSGAELELNTINIRKENFTWATSFNISIPRNKLVSFPGLESSPAYADRYVVGEPLGISKVYHYIGVDPTSGIYQVLDANSDGNINSLDRQTAAFAGPRYFGGLQNRFNYRGFQLNMLFQFASQMGFNYARNFGAPGYMLNQPKYVLDRWQDEGDNSEIQRFGQSFITADTYGHFSNSDRGISNASFIRLKNVSFSYSLPEKWADKLRLSSARVYIQAQNLLTITKFEGLDPETQGTSLPPLRVLSTGISLSF